jgi:hypothetical protein
MPDKVTRNNDRLHCPNGSAIHFRDGYELFYWNGVLVPEEWIKDKNSITKEIFIKEQNAEKRRCIQEILGKDFVNLFDFITLDEDIDLQGNKMRLLKTKQIDEIAQKHIFYYHCICPSTKREYYLCVPECKNVWEAKNWGMMNKKPAIRHGDVILKQIDAEYEFPIYES